MSKILKKLISLGRKTEYRYRKIAEYAKGEILDIGCGKGNTYLRGKIVIGLDIKPPKEKPKNYNKIIKGNAVCLTEIFGDKKFDAIVASEVIEHLHNPVKFFVECNKHLKMGGTLIITTDNPYRWQTVIANILFPKGLSKSAGLTALEGGHVNFFIPRMLNALASQFGFKIKDIVCVEGINIPSFQQKLMYIYTKVGSCSEYPEMFEKCDYEVNP